MNNNGTQHKAPGLDLDLNLSYYTGDMDEDGLLLQWWAALVDGGDMEYVFFDPDTTPAQFLSYFQQPKQLVYGADHEGVWFAQWFEPWMSGAFVGIWVRPDKRRTKAMALAAHTAFSHAFEIWPTVIAVTKKKSVVRDCEFMGFSNMGQLGKIFGGKDAWLLSCEKAAFKGAIKHGRLKGQKVS